MDSHGCTVDQPSVQPCEGEAISQVGEIRLSHSDSELEQHIASLAKLSEQAMAAGDPTGARLYAEQMKQAIAQRSPEAIARMEKVIDEGLDFFSSTGAAHRRMRLARGIVE
jgi:hypothetical protein